MKPTNVCLSKSEISLLLSSDLPPDENAAAEQHIAECETCRSAIESMIADSRWWDDARQSLVACATRSMDPEEANHDEEPTTTEQMLELLGPTDDPAMLGRIGVYEIVGILGRGGMGVVFKGYDGALNPFVAIKMLLPHLAVSGAARKRFVREAQAVAAVVDDHVMAIHGVSEWKSVPYFVMPYARGVSLQKRLSNERLLELREILRIGMQAAKGLAAAHSQGLVHRDVKPANIFLDEGVERVQLMDFGLARAVDDASLTRSGTLAGTPQYMSPEQARAETVDNRSDLFSLGSVLYTMCTGHAPFRAESSYGVLRLITDDAPRPIREINTEIPEWLCAIISKLMAKQAIDRFESAQQVADLLEGCLAHVQQPTTIELPTLIREWQSLHPSIKSQHALKFGLLALSLSCIVVLTILYMMWTQIPDTQVPVAQVPDSSPREGDPDGRQASLPAHERLRELLALQKAREASVRQISFKGTVRQYAARPDIQRTNTESVDEFVARVAALAPVYDEYPLYPLSVSRDFTTGVYQCTCGNINAVRPKYMDWLIGKKEYVQLMGREQGACQAAITNNRKDIQDDRTSSWAISEARLDISAFRPVKDVLMSEVVMKAATETGHPDIAGRPLWKLEKLDDNAGWKATFMFQNPVDDKPGTKQILWYSVFWKVIGGELVIVRFDRLHVLGDQNSTPSAVVLLDDYRTVCGKPVPFRVRFYSLGKTIRGIELIVSDVRLNDYVDVPVEMPIPAGSPVFNFITGMKYRQPENMQTNVTEESDQLQGTWNVVEVQQIGRESSDDERELYKNGGHKITFTKSRMIHSPDHRSMQYRVDTTQSPHVLVLSSDGKVVSKAIYELKNDELRVCQGRAATDGEVPKPPTSFDISQAAPSDLPTLMVLRRTNAIEPISIQVSESSPGNRNEASGHE